MASIGVTASSMKMLSEARSKALMTVENMVVVLTRLAAVQRVCGAAMCPYVEKQYGRID